MGYLNCVPFSFHPPTRTHCEQCEKLARSRAGLEPLISQHRGKASSADSFPVHNWFNFVLGYSPEFPVRMFEKFSLDHGSLVLDPFTGSGTTQVAAKNLGIQSIGVEANDYFHFAATSKLNWSLSTKSIEAAMAKIRVRYLRRRNQFHWDPPFEDAKFSRSGANARKLIDYVTANRPQMMDTRYISDRSLGQFLLLQQSIDAEISLSKPLRRLLDFALTAVLVPCSNVRYGPGFGVTRRVRVVDVLAAFEEKVSRILADLERSDVRENRRTKATVHLGDSRNLSKFVAPHSVDAMVTSPPYPGDHEYTKHSRIELIWCKMAQDKTEFRRIKQRMLRGSTTNVYREDRLGDHVRDLISIRDVTAEIDARLRSDGASSGFEKLYTKLVWEYFGGMYLVFVEAKKVLKHGAPFSLLVSDSHAFKMTHIATADILAEVALLAGFNSFEQELWQLKSTTSHGYSLFENVLTVR